MRKPTITGTLGGGMSSREKNVKGREGRHSSAGFSLVEIIIVIVIMGLLIGIGALGYSNISQGMSLHSARKQVEAALTRAKLSARQENVEYRIIFYPDGGDNENTYEFMCYMYDELNDTWSLQPTDKSVGDERVVSSGGHYYVEIGRNVKITAGGTVVFRPEGTEQTVTSIPAGESEQTIGLAIGSRSGSVSIDAQGKIEQR